MSEPLLLDRVGQPLKVGDKIAWGKASTSAGLILGVIDEIEHFRRPARLIITTEKGRKTYHHAHEVIRYGS